MPITTLLTIGPPHNLIEDQIYAMPARAVLATVSGVGTIETSSVIDSGFAAMTLTGNQFYNSASFLRPVGGIATITLKAFPFDPF